MMATKFEIGPLCRSGYSTLWDKKVMFVSSKRSKHQSIDKQNLAKMPSFLRPATHWNQSIDFHRPSAVRHVWHLQPLLQPTQINEQNKKWQPFTIANILFEQWQPSSNETTTSNSGRTLNFLLSVKHVSDIILTFA